MWLRRRNDDARGEVVAVTGELAGIAEVAVGERPPGRGQRPAHAAPSR